ncbi:MAG: Aspartate aminotransferase [Candidatus Roizmanbacteria bacterium GW2011_GWC2_37_13]|uniref:Aminotransferase n=1 Tax=Candidatus Roizmanbacteria bacterium GW2011_GWC2_37_13 TaxID=1618486 RepID=A0A0G0GKP1_9BACT|nr:MAG: Aspartate/tyrosine/aromatic aminotransferase [Candidatus Roizmanbacteria bacterium GW2011_GWC1_37_12]KKQ26700.1 MAG: Aspartate aminotransferase [Candidatus Roizmanbacteria bacterium GW2011_GWC2_37_13]
MKNSSPPFSKQLDALKAEGAYAVLNKATKLETEGKKIIHFEIGQPDFPTPQNITSAAISALKKGLTKYNAPLGIMPLRRRIAQGLNETKNISVSENNIAVTPSGKTAIFVAMSSILEKGDEVIHPDPGFPTYRSLIDFLSCKPKPIPLLEETGFSFDMKIFKKNFSKKTKLVILNSPSNPTGGIIKLEDLEEIREMVKKTNCWVMTDEMYSKIIYDGIKYPSFYSFKSLHHQTILVDGFSKTFSMTGWRIGYLSAPASLIEKIDYFLTHTVGCTATFTQYAVLEGLNGPQNQVKKMVKEFEKRRNFVVSELNKIKGIKCQIPQGAFYVFPNIKSFKKSSKWIANYLLEEAGVALLDGTSFGKYGEGYLRISYATSMENLKEGIDRIKKGLNNL